MRNDAFLKLDTDRLATSFTGSGATSYSANSVPLQALNRDIGEGTPLFLMFSISTTFTTGSGATMNFGVAYGTGVDVNGVMNAGQVILVNTAVAIAALVVTPANQGKRYYIAIPPVIFNPSTGAALVGGAAGGFSHVAASYFVGTGTYTAGAVSCEITNEVQGGHKIWRSGYSVTV